MKRGTAIRAMQHGMHASRGFLAMHAGLICLAAVLLFVASGMLLQWVRHDLDWRLAPMSSYLRGPYGGWLRLAYYGLGLGLVLLGQGLHRTLQPVRSVPRPPDATPLRTSPQPFARSSACAALRPAAPLMPPPPCPPLPQRNNPSIGVQ